MAISFLLKMQEYVFDRQYFKVICLISNLSTLSQNPYTTNKLDMDNQLVYKLLWEYLNAFIAYEIIKHLQKYKAISC